MKKWCYFLMVAILWVSQIAIADKVTLPGSMQSGVKEYTQTLAGLGRVQIAIESGVIRADIEALHIREVNYSWAFEELEGPLLLSNLYLDNTLFRSSSNELIRKIRKAAVVLFGEGPLRNAIHNFTGKSVIGIIQKKLEDGEIPEGDKRKTAKELLSNLDAYFNQVSNFEDIREFQYKLPNLVAEVYVDSVNEAEQVVHSDQSSILIKLKAFRRLRQELRLFESIAFQENGTRSTFQDFFLETRNFVQAEFLMELLRADRAIQGMVIDLLFRSHETISVDEQLLLEIGWHMKASFLVTEWEYSWLQNILAQPRSHHQMSRIREFVHALNLKIRNRVMAAELPESFLLRRRGGSQRNKKVDVDKEELAQDFVRTSLVLPLAMAVEKFGLENNLGYRFGGFDDPMALLVDGFVSDSGGVVRVVESEDDVSALTEINDPSRVTVVLNPGLKALPKSDVLITIGGAINSSDHLAMLTKNLKIGHLHVFSDASEIKDHLVSLDGKSIVIKRESEAIFSVEESDLSVVKSQSPTQFVLSKPERQADLEPIYSTADSNELPHLASVMRGGKSKGLLDMMIQAPEASVPDFGILSEEFFEKWVDSAGASNEWQRFKSGQSSAAEVEALVNQLSQSQIPDELMSSVYAHMTRLSAEGGEVIVRSSSNGEDGEFNAAGVNKTMITDLEPANLENAIKEVLLSPFNAGAQEWYRGVYKNWWDLRSEALIMRKLEAVKSSVIDVSYVSGSVIRFSVSTQWGEGRNIVDGIGMSELIFFELDLSSGDYKTLYDRPSLGLTRELGLTSDAGVVEGPVLNRVEIDQLIQEIRRLSNVIVGSPYALDLEVIWEKAGPQLVQKRKAPADTLRPVPEFKWIAIEEVELSGGVEVSTHQQFLLQGIASFQKSEREFFDYLGEMTNHDARADLLDIVIKGAHHGPGKTLVQSPPDRFIEEDWYADFIYTYATGEDRIGFGGFLYDTASDQREKIDRIINERDNKKRNRNKRSKKCSSELSQ